MTHGQRAIFAAVVAAAVLSTTGPLVAQTGAGPVGWLAFDTVKTGMVGEAVATTLEQDAETYDALVANGTILSWGMATPIHHRPADRSNFVVFVTLPSWARMDDWVAAFESKAKARSSEETAAMLARAGEIYENKAHFDSVVRHVHLSPQRKLGNRKARYFYIANYQAIPGLEEQVNSLYRKVVVPVARELQEDGDIVSFGLYVPELHGEGAWTHRTWFAVPDLAAIDHFRAAIGEAITPEIAARAAAMTDPAAHFDQIYQILHQSGSISAP